MMMSHLQENIQYADVPTQVSPRATRYWPDFFVCISRGRRELGAYFIQVDIAQLIGIAVVVS